MKLKHDRITDMNRLISIRSEKDIPLEYQNTPVGRLLEYHNLGREFDDYSNAQMLISMCMDNRKSIRIPENFAYILRAGGGNLRYSEFKVSYAISLGGVRNIVLIGHNNCGMVDLFSKKEQFVKGLVDGAGWSCLAAEKHFDKYVEMFEITDAIGFVSSEAKRLNVQYPKIEVVPLMFQLEDKLLYAIQKE